MNADEVVDKDYTNCCYLCGDRDRLRMFPIRKQGDMVGWIFICGEHEDHEIPETVTL